MNKNVRLLRILWSAIFGGICFVLTINFCSALIVMGSAYALVFLFVEEDEIP